MRSAVPWSVKGIEPEAREAAKQAARRAGVTLGAWLNQIIMDGGTDEVEMQRMEAPLNPNSQNPSPHFAGQPVFSHPIDLAPVADAVREIVNRVEQSERRASDLARRLEQSVGQLAERVEHSERTQSERVSDRPVADRQALDPLERKIQQLAERLEDAERTRATFARKADDKTQIQSLEKAVNAVVDHLEAAERRTEEALHDIRRTLGDVSSRVSDFERTDERGEAQARSQKLETYLHTLANRLDKMEHSIGGVASQAVEAALRALAEKTDADEQTTADQLQRTLGDITQRLERAESRTNETLKTFEMTVSSIARRLEELDTPRDEPVQVVEARLEELAGRLNKTEDMTLQAAQAIERAIAGMSDSMHVSESRSRETIGSLHVMLERMTDRLGRIEREAKAAQGLPGLGATPAMPAPQVAAGQPTSDQPAGGNGFVPGGQTFPIPNFDAPSLNSVGNAFDGPADAGASGDDYRNAPMPPASPFDADVAAPPFVALDEGGRREPRLDMGEPEADPEIDNPTHETAQAANEFLAAARRAAQAAAMNGRGPQPVLGGGFSDPKMHPAAGSSEDRRRKIILGLVAAVMVVAVALGARHLMKQDAVVVASLPVAQTPIAADANPGDMAANTQTTIAATVPETQSPIRRDTSPEEGASATPAAAAPTPAASPIVPAAQARKPEAPMTRLAEKLPAATPAPAKPVASAPMKEIPPTERTLRVAATEGNPAAQYEVAQRYANGENLPQDLKQAAYWYKEAADQGLAIAQYRLAVLYEKGRGVAQDAEQARTWYERAANQGNVKAMHNLAVIYAEGRGTRQDFTTAARWFAQAAEFGLGDSQYNLAILQERGLGVKQDFASAYQWLSIGAKGGDKGAIQKRDELATRLDAAVLAKARAAAQSWSPKRPDPLANGDLSSMGNWRNASSETTEGLGRTTTAELAGSTH